MYESSSLIHEYKNHVPSEFTNVCINTEGSFLREFMARANCLDDAIKLPRSISTIIVQYLSVSIVIFYYREQYIFTYLQ